MPDATAAAPTAPHAPPPSRSGRLLGLVRKLIDYGQTLVASLQQRNTPEAPDATARRFGTFDLSLIIAHITRGLRVAAVLQARLVRGARLLDAPRPGPAVPRGPARPPAAERPKRPRPSPWPTDDEAALRNLPSVQEIARRLRHRTIGNVIADICLDLGIGPAHPLWQEIRDAVIAEDGMLVPLVMKPIQRICLPKPLLPPAAMPPPVPLYPAGHGMPLATATHPP
jgi:hypothetical protein